MEKKRRLYVTNTQPRTAYTERPIGESFFEENIYDPDRKQTFHVFRESDGIKLEDGRIYRFEYGITGNLSWNLTTEHYAVYARLSSDMVVLGEVDDTYVMNLKKNSPDEPVEWFTLTDEEAKERLEDLKSSTQDKSCPTIVMRIDAFVTRVHS